MKKTFLFLAIAAFAIQVNAQTHFSLHAGGTMPMGNFGSFSKVTKLAFASTGKEGGASMGFNLGMKVKFDIASVEGLGVILTGDVFLNSLQSDVSDKFEKMYGNGFDLTLPKYLNIPIMVGANYTYNISNSFGIYGEGAVGLNIQKTTNFVQSADYDGVEYEVTTKFDLATSLGFQIGAGVIFNEKFSIGLHYYALGTNKLKGNTDNSDESGYDDYDWDDYDWKAGKEAEDYDDTFKGGKLTTGMLVLRLGFHF